MSRFAFLSSLLSVATLVAGDATTYGQNAICTTDQLLRWYNAPGSTWHDYWWESANMMSAVADLAILDPEYGKIHMDTFSNTFDNAPKALNYNQFLNDFYDDEGWWALAWLNVYDLTKDQKYLDHAITMWKDIHGGQTTKCGAGSIWWSKKKDYVASIANELYMQLSAGIANRVDPKDKPTYLGAAEQTWEWFMKSGLIGQDNYIVDGLDPDTCKPKGQVFSYNQGIILGAAVELHAATGNDTYLDRATTLAETVVRTNTTLTDEHGILMDGCGRDHKCGGDGEDFTGPFIKNLRKLQLARPRDDWRDFIANNAQSVWKNDVKVEDGACMVGGYWQGPYAQADPSTQSDALDALIAAYAVTGKKS